MIGVYDEFGLRVFYPLTMDQLVSVPAVGDDGIPNLPGRTRVICALIVCAHCFDQLAEAAVQS